MNVVLCLLHFIRLFETLSKPEALEDSILSQMRYLLQKQQIEIVNRYNMKYI